MNATGTEIICIGFNCRPLVELLARAGYRPVVIDYFGDLDIRPHVTDGHYFVNEVMGEQRENSQEKLDPDEFRVWALAKLENIVKERTSSNPLILPGSGFDDELDAWRAFTRLGRVLGSSPESVVRARDLAAIADLFRGTASPILIPETRQVIVDSATDPVAAAREVQGALTFPVLAKRTRTAGGAGIDIAKRPHELEQLFKQAQDMLRTSMSITPVVFNVQEFVGGGGAIDASVIALGEHVVCKTQQIIGDVRLHAPKRFTYCGNIIPFNTGDPRLDHPIDALVMELHRDFGLKGLYGIDMVIAKGKMYLVEINPRVPGSIEVASIAHGRNLIADHVTSFLSPGTLPHAYTPVEHAIKHILFAAKDFTMPSIDAFSMKGEVHDITPPGIQIAKGMPIMTCTHHGPLDTAMAVETTAMQDIKNLYEFLERGSP